MNQYHGLFFLSLGAIVPSGPWPPHSRGLFFYITHDTPQSVGLLWTSDQVVAETSTWQHTTLTTNMHAPGGIRTHDLSRTTDLIHGKNYEKVHIQICKLIALLYVLYYLLYYTLFTIQWIYTSVYAPVRRISLNESSRQVMNLLKMVKTNLHSHDKH